MSVDYDLIILGATPAGIQAAIAAATLKARVALITQNCSPQSAPELIHHHTLLQLAHQTEQLYLPATRLLWEASGSSPTLRRSQVKCWLDMVANHVGMSRSVAALAAQGVDVIDGIGEFCRKPAPGVVANRRFLQARGYLLTPGSCPRIPAIAGLNTVPYFTPETLPTQLDTLSPGATVAILGSGKTAVELAQALRRLGQKAMLLTEYRTLLPDADQDVAAWAQALLEAEGVQVCLAAVVEQVRSHADKIRLWCGKTVLDVDHLLVAAGHSPNLASLNLEAVGVQWSEQGIPHNLKLQTSNPRVYSCEGRVGHECFPQMANHEAAIALKNILFFPRSTVAHWMVPLTVHTSPELAWLGLTSDQATRRYGNHQVFTLRQPLHALPKAQMQETLSGFCKLIVHRNGTLLGAHLVGPHASEWIGILALAMQQRLKIRAIATLPLPSPTFAEILRHTAADFRRLQLKHAPWQQDWVDNFFDWRRAWSRN